MNSPNDPEPSLVVEDGRIVELDGRREQDWDALDHFVVRYGLDLDVAAEAAELDGRRDRAPLVDIDVPRDALVRLSRGLTPARLARVIAQLDPLS
jgi:Propanediol dehydratase, large subunit